MELQNRDARMFIDFSGSMSIADGPNGMTRIDSVKESAEAFARKLQSFDPDGITVHTFASNAKRYDDVTPDKVTQVFTENDPMGTTNLAAALRDAVDDFLNRRGTDKAKPNGELWVVVTDGQPDDRDAVVREIQRAANGIDKDEELGILFLQVGNDAGATAFLEHLDDNIEAKFDVVDTIKATDAENQSITETLLGALND